MSAVWGAGPLPLCEFGFVFMWAVLSFVGPWWFSLPPFLLACLFAPPFWFWCCVCCGLVCWSFVVGPLVLCVVGWFVWGVGPAVSHGLDCTAANYTGAVQWSSLPCGPERPRAAKSAHMVCSVGSSGIAERASCHLLCICARCCNLLLTAWTVQHYCKQCWDDETLTALNSYAWLQVRNCVTFEGATLQVVR